MIDDTGAGHRAAFGRMLQVFCGFGMRIAFVDEEDVNDEPEIVVREPEGEGGSMSGEVGCSHGVKRRFEAHQVFSLTPIMVRRWPE